MLAPDVALVGALAKDRITSECKRFDRKRDLAWARAWVSSASGKAKDIGDHEMTLIHCFDSRFSVVWCFDLMLRANTLPSEEF
jgi:hypothetical protein